MKQANPVAALAVVLSMLCASGIAAADPQSGPVSASQPSNVPAGPALSWLTAYRFHLSAASVRTSDPRFDWDAHFGGDVDLIDYGVGRLNLLADYAVIIGSEFRTIDPNQGAYHLAVSTSLRSGPAEVQAVFRHVSRHLSDRANRTAVAWNAGGIAATAQYGGQSTKATVTAYGAKVVQAAFVDYTWQFAGGVDAEHRLSPAAAFVARAQIAPTLVDQSVAGRGAQTAATLEAGVRLYGRGAALELFAAWERRLDPYPLERAAANWALVGFRFVNR